MVTAVEMICDVIDTSPKSPPPPPIIARAAAEATRVELPRERFGAFTEALLNILWEGVMPGATLHALLPLGRTAEVEATREGVEKEQDGRAPKVAREWRDCMLEKVVVVVL